DALACIALTHKRKPGGDNFAGAVRNLAIIEAIKVVSEVVKLEPTRSDATKNKYDDRACACSIVAEACKRLGIKLGERALEKIWVKRHRSWDYVADDPFLNWMAGWYYQLPRHLYR